jgi:hypothetical protein
VVAILFFNVAYMRTYFMLIFENIPLVSFKGLYFALFEAWNLRQLRTRERMLCYIMSKKRTKILSPVYCALKHTMPPAAQGT